MTKAISLICAQPPNEVSAERLFARYLVRVTERVNYVKKHRCGNDDLWENKENRIPPYPQKSITIWKQMCVLSDRYTFKMPSQTKCTRVYKWLVLQFSSTFLFT